MNIYLKWGSFTNVHLISLALVVVLCIAMTLILKRFKPVVVDIILFIMSLSGIAAIIYNLVAWKSPLQYLPLHMCSINALILPFAVLTKNKYITNLLSLWALGAVMALVMNGSVASSNVFSGPFNFYFFPHIFEFYVPIALFIFKRSKLDFKTIPITLLITVLIIVGVHFINKGVNAYTLANNITDYTGNVIRVNYIYTLGPDGYPVLSQLWSILPVELLYLITISPLVILALVLLNIKNIIAYKKDKKTKEALTTA